MDKRTVAAAIAILSVSLAICGLFFGTSQVQGKGAVLAPGVSLLVREELSFATLMLEKREGLALNRLIIKAEPLQATDRDVDTALATIRSILNRKQPVTVHYDLSDARMVLTWRQLWHGVEWVRERDNAKLMDRYLQCISLTMRPGIVKSAVSTIVQLLSPPQPVHIGVDDASAISFAQKQCRKKRDWTAASAAREAARSRQSGDTHSSSASSVGEDLEARTWGARAVGFLGRLSSGLRSR